MKRPLSAAVLFTVFFSVLPLSAEKPPLTALESTIKENTIPSPAKPAGRPSVALVLAGGGARGFAHIPVLEMLEEYHIPVDMVIGNSAGAIVGGLWCAGYSPDQIRDAMYPFSHGAVLNDASYSPFEQILGEHSRSSTLLGLKFGTKNGTFTLGMGNGVLTGQNVYELLKRLTVRIPSDADFDTLRIPFRAVTTNLLTGQLEVRSHGDIAEAVRCSLSIPGIFQPFEMDGSYYVDGMALDNTPIDVAVKMGYDIIIVSNFPDGMENSSDKFNANPFVAVLQMMNMEQAARGKINNSFADLMIYPDFANETLIGYPHAEKIYSASRVSMEKYRAEFTAIHDKIYAGGKTEKDVIYPSAPLYTNDYEDNTYLRVNNLKIVNADSQIEKFIRKEFAGIKDRKFTEDDFTKIVETIYHTGKYRNVITRITGTDNEKTLEIMLRPEDKEKGIILLSGSIQGSCAMDSTLSISIASDIQWRGLTGYGSVISARLALFNGVDADFMFRQPIGPRLFSQLNIGYLEEKTNTGSGWAWYPASVLLLRKADAQFKFGVPFNGTRQVLSTGTGFNWFDTDDDLDYGTNSMAGDFFAEYTLNTLDSFCFPTRGMYLSLKGTGVLPVQSHDSAPILDITQADFLGAVPFGKAFNIIIDGFLGTDISEQMQYVPGLLPAYGFSLADRRFFPQICSPEPWGLHKAALSSTLQFSPDSELTLLGMKAFIFLSGAAGNVWNSYTAMTVKDLQWRADFDAGIRIQNAFGMLLRIGAGTSRGYVVPFVSLDIGNIRF